MGDSIAAAVRATAQAPGWLVLPGDLPLIRPDTLRTMAAALADPDTRAKLAASGMEVAPGTSQQLKDAIAQEIKVHAELVKAAGLVPQ